MLSIEQCETTVIDKHMLRIACCLLLYTLASIAWNKTETFKSNVSAVLCMSTSCVNSDAHIQNNSMQLCKQGHEATRCDGMGFNLKLYLSDVLLVPQYFIMQG